MRAVEMQPAVIQSLNVQAQQQQQLAQPQISQEAFAAALERTASLKPGQVQQLEATPEHGGPEMLGEDRGESTRQRRRGTGRDGRGGDTPSNDVGGTSGAEVAAGADEGRGSKIDLVV